MLQLDEDRSTERIREGGSQRAARANNHTSSRNAQKEVLHTRDIHGCSNIAAPKLPALHAEPVVLAGSIESVLKGVRRGGWGWCYSHHWTHRWTFALLVYHGEASCTQRNPIVPARSYLWSMRKYLSRRGGRGGRHRERTCHVTCQRHMSGSHNAAIENPSFDQSMHVIDACHTSTHKYSSMAIRFNVTC